MRQLELKFKNQAGNIVTFALDEPKDSITSEEVNTVMNDVISENAFTSSGGDLLEKHSARIVERIVDDIEIM